MSEFRVKIEELINAAGEYERLASILERASSEISTVRRNLSFQVRQRQQISSRLKTASQAMDGHGRKLRRMSATGKNVANLYRSTENKLLGTPERKPEKTDPSPFEWTFKDSWKVLSQFGLVGKTAASVATLWSEGWSASTGFTLGKNLLSVIGGTASTIAKGSDAKWIEALFGTKDVLKNIDGNPFTHSLKQQFLGDLFGVQVGKNATPPTWGDKVNTVTKWGGHILTLASNTLDNYNEYGEFNAKMWAETGIETAVDIGVGALATAGVTAAASALAAGIATVVGAPVTVPALAIGVASAGLVWAANGVCKWITGGDDLAETASNLVWKVGDGVKWVGEKAVEGAKWIGEQAKAGVETVTKWAGDAIDSAKEKIGGAVENIKSGWKAITRWGKSPAFAGGW